MAFQREHEHYYFMATTKDKYEAVLSEDDESTVFVMVEYAYLICTKCGDAFKTRVIDKDMA